MTQFYYTYAYLREDRTPYYIGKGKGDRAYKKERREFKPPKDKSRIIFLKQNLTEEEAFKHEIYMIAVFGRKDLGTGILRNRTDGGEGVSNQGTPEQRSEIARKRQASMTPEQRSEIARKRNANMTPEQMSERAKKAQASKTPEQRSEIARKRHASKTPEQRSEIARKREESMTPEQKSERAKKRQEKKRQARRKWYYKRAKSRLTSEQLTERQIEVGKKTSSQKWQCTVTGYISNACGLTNYQKARGIDTSNRIRIS